MPKKVKKVVVLEIEYDEEQYHDPTEWKWSIKDVTINKVGVYGA